MNERDSEKLKGILKTAGFELTDEEEGADLVLYNTCTVRDNAAQRVYGRLGVLKREKLKNPWLITCLCGCLMQEEGSADEVLRRYPYVDLIFGTQNIARFPGLLLKVISGEEQVLEILKEPAGSHESLPAERKYPFKSGVNIMYGCDNFCSYCIVPFVRGRERSREAAEILKEIESLVRDGVKEVMLLGQNVNSYGKGLPDPVNFAALLREVEKTPGLERIRFMTSHPKDLSDELIEVMASSGKICRHLHLPLQSGSDRILEDMNRHYTKESYLSLVHRLRNAMPELAITTDIIVGYPTETREDVEDTIDVVKRAEFEGAFTFIYSKRAGTKAASLPETRDSGEIGASFDRVLKTVQEVSSERLKRFTGKRMSVLVEGVNERDPKLLSGRLSQNTVVHFPGEASAVGSIVPVRLTACRGFYFLGERQD
ncbi:MAG: tRNA (N6-isopentenyl adenosine(37)-C2)-methylthiotransferase MiaB [Lachnospiraceae bacterium]|nr:tRNA (N6-isopentenyl adenosine(37)-C2)-methylthiotransferase MiaB [Lachnospiraceae bacterium]